MRPLPRPLSYEERGEIIAPPSLAGKGVGGLGHFSYQLSVISYQLSVISYQLLVISY